MKYLTKILQRGKNYLNVDAINTTIKNLILSEKLILTANTLPVFTLAQMFIISDNEKRYMSENKDLIVKIYEMIDQNIAAAKDQHRRPP